MNIDVWERQRAGELSASEPRFHVEQFFNRAANTVYICAPPEIQRDFRPYFTAFIRLFFREAYRRNRGFSTSLLGLRGAAAAIDESEGIVTPLLVQLDDAGALFQIADFDNVVRTATQAAIQLTYVFTDVSQLHALYGEDRANSIINSYSTFILMPGSHDIATNSLVDHLLGGADPRGLSHMLGNGSEGVRRLPWGRALLIAANQEPAIIDLRSSMTDSDLLTIRGLITGE